MNDDKAMFHCELFINLLFMRCCVKTIGTVLALFIYNIYVLTYIKQFNSFCITLIVSYFKIAII